MEKFTKGPWRIASQNYKNCFYFIVAADDSSTSKPQRELMVVKMDEGPHPIKEHLDRIQADAALIAAAPDLYRELKHLVRLIEPLEKDGGLDIPGLATLNGARAALAKATK